MTMLSQRFWANVNKASGVFYVGDRTECWVWTGAGARYGQFRDGQHFIYAHRLSYEATVSPIPAGLQIDHLCRNPRCVRPNHLEPVSAKTNISRRVHPTTVKYFCTRGHPFDTTNTYRPPGTRHRQCRECTRERQRAAYWARKAA